VITKREQQIIDLFDQGAKAPQIAAELGLSLEYVQSRIRTLCHGCGPDSRSHSDMAQGSRQLRDAIILAKNATPDQLRVLCFIHGYQVANKGATPAIAHVATSLEIPKATTFESIHALTEIGALRVRSSTDNLTMDVLMKPAIPMIEGAPLYVVAAGAGAV